MCLFYIEPYDRHPQDRAYQRARASLDEPSRSEVLSGYLAHAKRLRSQINNKPVVTRAAVRKPLRGKDD